MESRLNDCSAKGWLQDNLYTHIGARMKSNVMIVGRPFIEEQITNGLKVASTPRANIYLVEKNRIRCQEIERRFWNIDSPDQWPDRWQGQVHVVYGDVAGYETAAGLNKPVRFEDLNIGQTMRSMRYLVGHRLLKQSNLKSKLRKCMLITSSLHKCDLDKTLAILHRLLNEILGVKAVVWPNAKGRKHAGTHKDVGVKEYAPYIEQHGRLLKNGLRLFSYQDKSPMFACMILYI